jgi:hypothetical protein
MAKKWNKVMARIQALEDALAGLLSGKAPKRKTAKKAKKAKAKTKARKPNAKKAARAATARPARKAAKTPAPKKRTAKTKRRIAVAEAAPILPQAPLLAL